MALTKQALYERKVALKIAEMVIRDGVAGGVREAREVYENAINDLSPDGQMYWYQNCYKPSMRQKEVNGTPEEQRAMAALLAEVKNGGKHE